MARSKTHSRSKTRLCHKAKSPPKVQKESRKQRQTKKLFSGWRAWCIRLALAIVVPILFFSLIELGLFVFGFGYPPKLFVETQDKGILITNEWFVWFYQEARSTRPHPALISASKHKGTIRAFVLGESAAMGTPDPSFGFARILEFMLQQYFPNHRVEVVNAALRGINSHVIVPIARQCVALEPDLLVVYMGNNEICGFYGPETFLGRNPALIPAYHRLKQTRIYQLLRIAVKGRPAASQAGKDTQTMEFFREHTIALDDHRREAAYRNYRNNLKQICDSGLQAGASVLIATVPVNLRDCPPLASLHREDLTAQDLTRWQSLYRSGIEHEDKHSCSEALSYYLKAAAIDDHYAELHFRLGRCYLATGEIDSAREHLSLARDWDALQFRTDSRLNEIIRIAVAEYGGRTVRLVDAERALAGAERCRDGIPGGELFYDHVHPRFDGDYELAKAILQTAVKALQHDRGLSPSLSAAIPSRDDCTKRLAFTNWDQVNTAAAMVKMTAQPPFTDQLDHPLRQSRAEKAVSEAMNRIDQDFVERVLQIYNDAIRSNPDDWQLRYNVGTFLYQLKRFPAAAEHMEHVVNVFPNINPFRMLLGYSLAEAGRLDEAIGHFRHALECNPNDGSPAEALKWALQQKNATPILKPAPSQ